MTTQSKAPQEASLAERARTLLHRGRIGTLSTQSRRHSGFPFGSLAPYGVTSAGAPTFLFSRLAMHTQNLVADGHAGLLVAQPEWQDDPLAGERVTVLGLLSPVATGDANAVRDDYLTRHPNAATWVDFADFAFYWMDIVDVYYVAGFGSMGWVDAGTYHAAPIDPLVDIAPSILAHMNADHRDALMLCCAAFGDGPVDHATMTAVDRLGFNVRARRGDRQESLRIDFSREIGSAESARAVLMEMVNAARARCTSDK